ncbi:MAG: hypothetical protein Pg6B_08820 [Candidatus Azobacteroides pseudotrichonymphae]|nr:MAG: hypothetical protein Pg6B_08820 [Candidatus Azobacteroides pseudotrichonymphae]
MVDPAPCYIQGAVQLWEENIFKELLGQVRSIGGFYSTMKETHSCSEYNR